MKTRLRLVTVILLCCAAWWPAPVQAASSTITPPVGPRGTLFQLEVVGFAPAESIRFAVSTPDGRPTGLAGVLTAGMDGRARIGIRSETLGIGTYRVDLINVAGTGTGTTIARNDFSVSPDTAAGSSPRGLPNTGAGGAAAQGTPPRLRAGLILAASLALAAIGWRRVGRRIKG